MNVVWLVFIWHPWCPPSWKNEIISSVWEVSPMHSPFPQEGCMLYLEQKWNVLIGLSTVFTALQSSPHVRNADSFWDNCKQQARKPQSGCDTTQHFNFTSRSLNLRSWGQKDTCHWRGWNRRHGGTWVKGDSETERCDIFWICMGPTLHSRVNVCLIGVNFCWIELLFEWDWSWWLMFHSTFTGS